MTVGIHPPSIPMAPKAVPSTRKDPAASGFHQMTPLACWQVSMKSIGFLPPVVTQSAGFSPPALMAMMARPQLLELGSGDMEPIENPPVTSSWTPRR